MALLVAIACVGFFFLVLHDFSERLPSGRRAGFRRWMGTWAIKGLFVPALVWVVFDGAIFDAFPTFSPHIEELKLAGHWLKAICTAATLALVIIGSYWAALTSGWLLVALSQQSEEKGQFKQCVLLWSAGLGPMALLMVCTFGWRFLGLALTLWFLPIVQRTLTIQPEQIVRPIYSQAIAKLHFDKHAEAEAAVLEQLEKCENDFDGWLLLADLYANHFQDLAGAEEIIWQTCDHPSTSASQVGVACHRLADWHLKLASDPMAARRSLWEICKRHPKSHLDRMARMRIDQIPMSKEELLANQSRKPIHMAERPRELDYGADGRPPPLDRAEALERARLCVEQLRKKPDDVTAREDSARLFVEQLDSVDQGLEQLQLLIAMPNASKDKVAQWLSLMASWQFNYKHDPAAGRRLLERVLELHPTSTYAFAAQSRINLLNAEARMRAFRPDASSI